jgi:hypothetical protein
MIEIFQRYATDKTISRAEAARQGMIALINKGQGRTAYFAHPFAWAPFLSLVIRKERSHKRGN